MSIFLGTPKIRYKTTCEFLSDPIGAPQNPKNLKQTKGKNRPRNHRQGEKKINEIEAPKTNDIVALGPRARAIL